MLAVEGVPSESLTSTPAGLGPGVLEVSGSGISWLQLSSYGDMAGGSTPRGYLGGGASRPAGRMREQETACLCSTVRLTHS